MWPLWRSWQAICSGCWIWEGRWTCQWLSTLVPGCAVACCVTAKNDSDIIFKGSLLRRSYVASTKLLWPSLHKRMVTFNVQLEYLSFLYICLPAQFITGGRVASHSLYHNRKRRTVPNIYMGILKLLPCLTACPRIF